MAEIRFLDRTAERGRMERALRGRRPSLVVLYGRRRLGKSRLIREVLRGRKAVYYVGDEREGALQRTALARECGRLVPGFDRVTYPGWAELFERWWVAAPAGSILALDEFPSIAAAAPEMPSLLQKIWDAPRARPIHLILCGSSQTMMQGLVLDRSAPLYGRATEILRAAPLPAGWIRRGLAIADPAAAVEAYAVWGGVPRYWDLARAFDRLEDAVLDLVLDPMGVLHAEPERLLRDDLRDLQQPASILHLVGAGCHRLSEIAGRLGKPATSLSRPLARLVELDLVHRELPFGTDERKIGKSLYRFSDPFLAFWFRFVAPNRSRLEAGRVREVLRDVMAAFPAHVGTIWEDLVRRSVPRAGLAGRSWKPARRWWGRDEEGEEMEIDVVAESADGSEVLIGEAEWSRRPDPEKWAAELLRKAERCPPVKGRRIRPVLWVRRRPRRSVGGVMVFDASDVMRRLV